MAGEGPPLERFRTSIFGAVADARDGRKLRFASL
jgi:hypothetical protein